MPTVGDPTLLLILLIILVALCDFVDPEGKADMPKYLIVEDLQKLLQERLSDPDLEAEYRRGFADGIGAFFQSLDDLPTEITRAELTEATWRWWCALMQWQQVEQGMAKEPPAFEWREVNHADIDH